jgi:hypothetical protein
MARKSSEVSLHRYGARKDVVACQENKRRCYPLTMRGRIARYLDEYSWMRVSIQAFSKDSIVAKRFLSEAMEDVSVSCMSDQPGRQKIHSNHYFALWVHRS